MRPVRLDIDGFASFRDPATVDFTDADYFALVGPTGSGKSTVVDAMTFALYGSAPRWGSVSSIQYALAPTANRCTVRLVFDVGGQRYVVAREVRRSGTQISQKSCLLERYVDPQATGELVADEPTESLAGDSRSVRSAVIDLLGLEFDDFCTCVVLPQGDFATFLKASVTERQNILLKLIGARHYDAIGKEAGRRAAQASTRVETLGGQLANYADATEIAEAAAAAREVELTDLGRTVTSAVAAIDTEAERRDNAAMLVAASLEEICLLEAVEEPEGTGTLDAEVRRTEAAYEAAEERERAADTSATEADERLQTGLQRGPLEETLRWHEERLEALSRETGLDEATRTAAIRLEQAQTADTTTEASLDESRVERSVAGDAEREVRQLVVSLGTRIAALTDVRAPEDVGELAGAWTLAAEIRTLSASDLAAAEGALAAADLILAGLPERSGLAELRRTIDAYAATAAAMAELTDEEKDFSRQAVKASCDVAERQQTFAEADQTFEQWRTQSGAAALRPHLKVGDRCPVCEQPVAVLPGPIDVTHLNQARAALVSARDDLAAAEKAQQTLAGHEKSVTIELTRSRAEQTRLDQLLAELLPDRPSGDDRDPDLDRIALKGLDGVLAEVGEAVLQAKLMNERARRSSKDAEAEFARIEERTQQAWAALHSHRGRLASEGMPEIQRGDLGAAWAAITTWTETSAHRLRTALEDARGRLRDAEERVAQLDHTIGATQAARRQAASALRVAIESDHGARLSYDALLGRLNELNRLLENRPALDETRMLLNEAARLEEASRQARTEATAASAARQHAERERAATRERVERARTELRAAREPLIRIGVPTIEVADLILGWSTLIGWCRNAIAERRRHHADAEAVACEASARLDDELQDLMSVLAAHRLNPVDHGIQVDAGQPDGVRGLPSMLTIEIERARRDRVEIARRRADAAALRSTIAKDTETQQVARELQTLMSSRRFPQWLADTALDTLVADASASLMQLSSNQFDLTHERGEFYVIDHADADARRSVRTLSGGETFQASLALALALSDQLATLAAGGRTTLDSIFLDEGFGTLDPDALEIVAGTLENLAQEERMVGVITHVQALAERVPVRFEVSRDTRTSTIERMGP